MTHRSTPPIRTLLAIDPGVRGVGAAIFCDGQLYDCAYLTTTEDALELQARALSLRVVDFVTAHSGMRYPDVVVCERMVYERRGGRSGRASIPEDLLAVTHVGGVILGAFPAAMHALPTPRTWKGGSIPKEVHHPRMLGGLPYEALRVITIRAREVGVSKAHNMLDAVGIGLWGLAHFV